MNTKNTMLKTMCTVHVLATALFVCGARAAQLELTQDTTITVPAGQTTTYSRLAGGAFTLTKKGEGTLAFGRVVNEEATIVVEEGALSLPSADVRPSFLDESEDRVFLVDAEKESNFALETIDGTNFITACQNMVQGFTRSLCDDSDRSAQHLAFLLTDSELANGRNIIDFGRIRTSNMGGTEGFGSFLYFQDLNTAGAPKVSEVFTVAMDREEVKTLLVDYPSAGGNTPRATPFVGVTANPASFIRGNRTSGVAANAPIAGTVAAVTGGSFELDGLTTYEGRAVAASLPYPDGLHVLNMRPTEAQPVTAIGNERANFAGGIRVALAVGFKTVLTEDQRIALSDYLVEHWVPQANRLKALGMKAGTRLLLGSQKGVCVGTMEVADGIEVDHPEKLSYDYQYDSASGTLKMNSAALRKLEVLPDGVRKVVQEGGSLTLADPISTDGAWMHVDAAQKLTLVSENGTNFVTKWEDVNANGRYADISTSSTAILGKVPAACRPFVRTEMLNGLDVVDFGGFRNSGWKDELAYGGWMRWSATCEDVKEVFSVCMDTEDLTNSVVRSVPGSDFRGAPLFGVSSGSNGHIRDNRSKMDTLAGLCLWGLGWRGGSSWELNGQSVTTGTVMPFGWNLVHVSIDSTTKARGNDFANERGGTLGGTRIAEFILYDQALTPEKRNEITAYLDAKWFNRTSAKTKTVSLEGLEVGTGTSLKYRYTKFEVGELAIGGTLEATEVVPAALESKSGVAKVEGRIVLGETGTLKVAWPKEAVKAARGRTVRLIGSREVVGGISGWTAKCENATVKLSVGVDGIYGTFAKNGLLLIVR